ncbi:tumor necrosis factor alpha-inducing protein [Helicobacter pylori]|uniref:Tumor necrosis factor alpha-inducing protein n=1 Tax=Helicobacter pylori Aklavik86 TaxID=1055532 RepID=K7Y768_HELPX|nr:tumor necrosis factor alpha-inducing protein [Helicobacter pylori]AFX89426.1 tumor necrosis factor alpha-inducing protein [Helicobacter pylori Aklavik86]WQS05269.1 tumor necrosis factor alpha-inducing protein [Helicobacter pylori]WQS08403.1 tumor necrosis factor alpha-inducing protein [Helicobacter pylori]WQS14674.1 tumor necrosis factor alpha-inducing protein [Helicobacter pylori]WQS21107.1 tumor necrosis factor alpha-inducing protein [Helicobacter pylori]
MLEKSFLKSKQLFLCGLGVLMLQACTCPNTSQKNSFLQDVPYWMLQNRSQYVTQGVDSSHIVDGKKTEEIEKIATQRAAMRVAQNIVHKLKEAYLSKSNRIKQKITNEMFVQMTQPIFDSLMNVNRLGIYINPNNEEVFALVRAQSFDKDALSEGLHKMSLDNQTVSILISKVDEIFKDSINYGDVKVPVSM